MENDDMVIFPLWMNQFPGIALTTVAVAFEMAGATELVTLGGGVELAGVVVAAGVVAPAGVVELAGEVELAGALGAT
jgi:hypothetical protein